MCFDGSKHYWDANHYFGLAYRTSIYGLKYFSFNIVIMVFLIGDISFYNNHEVLLLLTGI
jgi:hypothetical protein